LSFSADPNYEWTYYIRDKKEEINRLNMGIVL